MDNIQLSKEVESIFSKIKKELHRIEFKAKFSYSYKYAMGVDYSNHLDLLDEYVPAPYAKLLRFGVLRMEGDTEFLKLESEEKRISFLEQENISFKENWDNFMLTLVFGLDTVKLSIQEELSLLKTEILPKCEYYEILEFRELILSRLDDLTYPREDQDYNYYLEDNDLSVHDPGNPYATIGNLNLLEKRFNIIANKTYWATKWYYGLEDGFPREILDKNAFEDYKFLIDTEGWIEMETDFQLIKLYKAIAKLFLNKSSIETSENYESQSIFEKNIAKVLHEVLKELNAIDENDKAISRKFQPICGAFYQLHLDNEFELLKSTTLLKDFISYLNKPEVYDAKILGNSKLSSGIKHYSKVKELVKIEMNRAINE